MKIIVHDDSEKYFLIALFSPRGLTVTSVTGLPCIGETFGLLIDYKLQCHCLNICVFLSDLSLIISFLKSELLEVESKMVGVVMEGSQQV